jgi:hypothetical protein
MTDYGALSTRDTKGRVTLPARLMLEDRPDPDAPNRTVRGARYVDHLARTIGADRKRWSDTDRLRYWAAELYRDDWAIGEDGASPNTGETLPSLRTGAPGSYGPPDGRVDALARLRGARMALDAVPVTCRVAVFRVVIRNWKLQSVPGYSGRSHGALRDALMTGLDALAGHYEGMGR